MIQGFRLKLVMIGTITVISLILGFFGAIVLCEPVPPSVMNSIIDADKKVDYSDLPPISHFTARDGTALAYRFYGGTSNKIAILVHGSAGSSRSMHALAKVLSNNGITTFAVDIRGHGDSGSHGDIGYVGQLEEDMEDFVHFIRNDYPNAPLTLIGHSSGGGFALRIAGSPIGNLFSHYILLSPYLAYDSPTARPDSGGWASASIPRVMGILVLNHFGIHDCDRLPVVAFAVPQDMTTLTKAYSFRLWRNFKAHDEYLDDFRASPVPIAVIVGADDEILYAERFAPLFHSISDKVSVEIVPSVNHMGVISDTNALKAVIRHFQ